MAILLAGALTGVLAVCAIAGLFILKNAGSTAPPHLAPDTSHQSAPGAGGAEFLPLDGPPDACKVLAASPAQLVPGTKPTPGTATDTATEVRCSWGDVGLGDDPRELSVELRSVLGVDPLGEAEVQFTDEMATDKKGENLLPGQKQKYFAEVKDLGDQAYVLYLADSAFAQGILNARVGNILVTVSYGGSKSDDSPLSQDTCVNGAKAAAANAVAAIKKLGAA
ncbi:hypothetical protein LO762_00330 [Actinocorallia sp. API 0066]|uniref:hypothetical protein n=1 Tax=Actinocorallia sp. API 0066 TaxID=2896846 RepID=UPI001E54EA14|nr:hypothetical protein [Actinocorallia sp. API 0066]MCD0447649.1 hypothetical protein [Actinocorallia sp. API 0066]